MRTLNNSGKTLVEASPPTPHSLKAGTIALPLLSNDFMSSRCHWVAWETTCRHRRAIWLVGCSFCEEMKWAFNSNTVSHKIIQEWMSHEFQELTVEVDRGWGSQEIWLGGESERRKRRGNKEGRGVEREMGGYGEKGGDQGERVEEEIERYAEN